MTKLKKWTRFFQVTENGILSLKKRIRLPSTENRSIKKIPTSGPRLKNLLTVLILSSMAVLAFDYAYGHGVGSETFPPTELDGRLVTLEVSSSTENPDSGDDQQISISFIDFDSKITLRDVTFLIKAERGDEFLFEQEFKADNGFIVFNFVSEETASIIIEEDGSGNFLGSLLGLESRMVHVKGPKLSQGGLYKFDVRILAADEYSKKLKEPLVYNVGISIAQTTKHDFIDPGFGEEFLHIVTYYDEISGFNYDSNSKEISYFMPFEWTETNINQTSVVHQELVIPKKFGNLLVSGFTMHVNDVKLSEDIVNIDDFSADERTVHFIIYQKELFNVLENASSHNGMNIMIKPDRDYTHLSSVTDNGQFRILVSWEPENLESGLNAKVLFDVTDIFLKNKLVSTDYEFSVTQNDRVIFEQGGTSTDSKGEHNTAEFTIPDDVTGIVHLNFENLDNNIFAKSVIPVVINRVTTPDNDILVPDWIRNSALLWSQGQTDDDTFIEVIKYFINNKIIVVPQTLPHTLESQHVPAWLKNNAGWWADGQTDDDTFIQGIQFLTQTGIIRL